MKVIQQKDMPNIDLTNIPTGANIVYNGKAPVAVVMSIKYYSKLQGMIKQVKELMGKKK